MSTQQCYDICELPTELILEIVKQISYKDHSSLLLANKRYEKCLTRILYLRLLLPIKRIVIGWAIEHGFVRTLEKVDQVERLESFINCLTVTTTGTYGNDGSSELLELLPLHHASLFGQRRIIEYLVQKGANVNAVVAGGLLPIHFAKTQEVVQILVEHGSHLDAPRGITPLINSLSHQAEPSAVKAFFQLGADPNHVAHNGTTPAEMAVLRGNVNALETLLEAGADVIRPLPKGDFLIFKAIWSVTKNHGAMVVLKVVKLLLDHGASPDSGYASPSGHNNRPCFTPNLFLAVMMPESFDLVKLLLERGANQHQPYSRDRGSLGINAESISGFETAISDSLVANLVGRAVSQIDSSIETDIIPKLELLIQHGGNIDSQIEGLTLLQYCLRQNSWRAQKSIQLIPHLLIHGADANHLDLEGNKPLHTLTRFFFHRVQERWSLSRSIYYLKFHHPSPLSSLMDLLIDRGADPNEPDAEGRTPLMFLCSQLYVVHTALLIEILLGKSVDVNATDKWGCTALHYVVGQPGAVFHDEPCFRLQVLLNYSGSTLDVDICDKSGRTPLHLLLQARHSDQLSYVDERRRRITKRRALVMLIRAGANINKRVLSSTISMPLHKVHDKDSAAGVKNISEPPTANISESNVETFEDTPLHLAWQDPDPALFSILLRHGATAHINTVARQLRLMPLMIGGRHSSPRQNIAENNGHGDPVIDNAP